jgi:hypothetical protein
MEIGGEHAMPLLDWQIDDHAGPRGNAAVGHRDVERPERRLGLGHHAPAGLRVGDIGLDDHRAPAEAPDGGGRLLRGGGLLPVVHGDVRALAGELERDRAPDAARGAGDERDAALESHRSAS